MGLAAVLTASACFDLPTFPAGECGNGIIEVGEDCDLQPAPGHDVSLTCSASCRYECDAASPAATCPAGWGCGDDRVCRHGTGHFAVDGPTSFPASTLRAISVIGGVRSDVVGYSSGVAGHLRYDGGLHVSRFRINSDGALAVGDFDGDGRETLVLGADRLVVGWNADPVGDLRPMIALEPVPDDLDPSTQEVEVPEPGGRALALSTNAGHHYALYVVQGTSGLMLATLDPPVATRFPGIQGELSSLSKLLALGNIDTADGARGDEVAIAFDGGDRAWVIGTAISACAPPDACHVCAGGACFRYTPFRRSTVQLPPGLVVAGGTLFGDVDNSGAPDLLIIVAGGGVAVAYGDGAGGFDDGNPATPANAQIDPRFVAVADDAPALCNLNLSVASVGGTPLFASDLDSDGYTDYVTTTGIYLSTTDAQYCRSSGFHDAVTAAVLDYNDDGMTDVAVVDDGVGVIYSNGSDGTVFDPHPIDIPNGAAPRELVVGEFNGNYIDDLIVLASSAPGAPPDESWFVYGTHEIEPVVVTAGPVLVAGTSVLAGPFGVVPTSTDSLLLYGHDSMANRYFTASLVATPNGLISGMQVAPEGALSMLAIAHFTPGGGSDGELLAVTPSELSVWPGQGAVFRQWGARRAPTPPVLASGVVCHGDVDRDGVHELLALGDAGGVTTLHVYSLDEQGQPQEVSMKTLDGVRAPVMADLVDLDADGVADLLAIFEDGGVRAYLDVMGDAEPVVLSSSPARWAVASNQDADPALEVAVLGAALELYDLDSPERSAEIVPGISLGNAASVIVDVDVDRNGARDLVVGTTPDSVVVLRASTADEGDSR